MFVCGIVVIIISIIIIVVVLVICCSKMPTYFSLRDNLLFRCAFVVMRYSCVQQCFGEFDFFFVVVVVATYCHRYCGNGTSCMLHASSFHCNALLKMKPLQRKRFVACTCVIRAKQSKRMQQQQQVRSRNNIIGNDNANERVTSKRHVTFLSISECAVAATTTWQINILIARYTLATFATLATHVKLANACNMQQTHGNTLKTCHF